MRRRGVAVATVLAGGVLLLLFCLLVATFCLTQLDFSRNFREHTQSEQLARAAVAQVIAHEERLGEPEDLLQGASLNERYHWQNLFGSDSARLGGTACIGFSDAPYPGYYSLDNSGGTTRAAGCLDRGTERSVPPYSAQLLIRVQCGSRVNWYEAILQKRWPYVMATREPMTFTTNHRGPPSLATGRVLAMPSEGVAPVNSTPILLDRAQFQGLQAQRAIQSEGGITIGGPIGPNQRAVGNRLQGDADFMAPKNPPAVVVADGNFWEGTAREIAGDPKRLMETIMRDASRPAQAPTYLNLGQEMYRSPPNLQLMTRDVHIMGTRPPDFVELPGVEYAFGTDFVIDASLGNRYIPNDRSVEEQPNVRLTKHSLTLEDTRLYINGDLDLMGPREGFGPLLDGSNATLVVYGTLRIDGGVLDAVDQPMVIYCEKLVMKASGLYRGLITVRDNALFYPETRDFVTPTGRHATALLGFKLHGGVVVGGQPVLVEYDNDERYIDGQPPPRRPPNAPEPVLSNSYGACFFGTTLEYDPAYLKSLHRYGHYQLLSMRRVP